MPSRNARRDAVTSMLHEARATSSSRTGDGDARSALGAICACAAYRRAPPAPSTPPTVILAVATADRALIGPAIACLRDVWCAARAVSPASGPVLLRRMRLYPDVAEHDACSDLYLPLSE